MFKVTDGYFAYKSMKLTIDMRKKIYIAKAHHDVDTYENNR